MVAVGKLGAVAVANGVVAVGTRGETATWLGRGICVCSTVGVSAASAGPHAARASATQSAAPIRSAILVPRARIAHLRGDDLLPRLRSSVGNTPPGGTWF